jgi:hypothetical protein
MEILLWPGHPGPDPAAAPPPGVVAGPVFLRSDDLRRDVEDFRSRGVEFVDPEPVDYAFGARITALDPDGNRLELRQRPRGWAKER